MSGRYTDIVSGMLGSPEIISGADDFDLVAGLDDDDDGVPGLSGDDIEMISGAVAQKLLSNQQARQRVVERVAADKIAQGATMVRERPVTKGRTVPLGFDSIIQIPAGENLRIVASPQVVWKGSRVVVSPDIAGSFVIEDIFVGKNSQFGASGSVPARTFAPDAVGVELEWDTAQIGNQVTMIVRNISNAPSRFQATVIGKSVE